jgi:hypothetical protein
MVRHPAAATAGDGRALKREVLTLVALVLLIDDVFVGISYAASLGTASGSVRLGYTVLWTAATLAVVLRSLGRIRSARLRSRRRA